MIFRFFTYFVVFTCSLFYIRKVRLVEGAQSLRMQGDVQKKIVVLLPYEIVEANKSPQ